MTYFKPGQIDLTERVAIETGLCRGYSFKRIANKLKAGVTVPNYF